MIELNLYGDEYWDDPVFEDNELILRHASGRKLVARKQPSKGWDEWPQNVRIERVRGSEVEGAQSIEAEHRDRLAAVLNSTSQAIHSDYEEFVTVVNEEKIEADRREIESED